MISRQVCNKAKSNWGKAKSNRGTKHTTVKWAVRDQNMMLLLGKGIQA